MFGISTSRLPLFARKKPVSHPTASGLYDFYFGDEFHPGAQDVVFVPKYDNPSFLMRGAGRLAGALAVTAKPVVVVAPQIRVSGIPVMTGTLVFQSPTESK